MADKLSTTGAVQAMQNTGEVENLPTLFGRLGDEVLQLVDTKLNLLKVEVKEEGFHYVRDGAMVGTGAGVVGVGFAIFNVAVALFVSLLFRFSQPVNYALGFLITGAVYMIIGGIVVKTMKDRLSRRALMPKRSVEELRKDQQWLKNDI